MKTNFAKTAFTGFLLILAVCVYTNPVNAQQDNQLITQQQQEKAQNDEFYMQHKQHSEQQHKQHDEQHKNIEAQRIAFITQRLDLTPDEAKIFWPVYNEYNAKRHEMRKSSRDADDLQKADIGKISESEASQMLDNQLIEAQKLLDLRKEYNTKFKSVLPAVKVLKLYDAEREFQKMLIDKLRQHDGPKETGK